MLSAGSRLHSPSPTPSPRTHAHTLAVCVYLLSLRVCVDLPPTPAPSSSFARPHFHAPTHTPLTHPLMKLHLALSVCSLFLFVCCSSPPLFHPVSPTLTLTCPAVRMRSRRPHTRTGQQGAPRQRTRSVLFILIIVHGTSPPCTHLTAPCCYSPPLFVRVLRPFLP